MILFSPIAITQNPVHFESPFIFLEYGITPDTLILGYDSFATDSLDPELGEEMAPQVPGYFGVRLQLPADTSIYTKKDFRFGCGRPDYHEYLIDIEPSTMVEVNWDWLMIYSITFIDPYTGQTIETIDFGNPPYYNLYPTDKIIIGIQYDGPLSWPTFQIFSPNGGETLFSGEDFLITWINSFLPPQKLWYSSDTGINWSLITDSIQYPYNNFLWQVPQLNSDSCLVRVGYFPCAYDVSNNFFSITSPVSVEVEKELPIEFSLSQNYPNPFNPRIKIKYTIPSVGTRDRVSEQIIVFDVLGNEVVTLVNEEKPAGEYEVEFTVGQDSSPDIASGIYFYQLKAGAFIQTKKMVLIR